MQDEHSTHLPRDCGCTVTICHLLLCIHCDSLLYAPATPACHREGWNPQNKLLRFPVAACQVLSHHSGEVIPPGSLYTQGFATVIKLTTWSPDLWN